MQSISHWIALVPSFTSYPHTPHGYYSVLIAQKAINRLAALTKQLEMSLTYYLTLLLQCAHFTDDEYEALTDLDSIRE